MSRHNILASAWIGEPLTLNGRELVLSAGRYELLKSWGNALFADGETDQSSAHAIHEVALLCYANGVMLDALRKMTAEDRHKSVVDFMLDHEAELPAIIDGLVARITAVKYTSAESEDSGKQDASPQVHTG